MRWGSREQNKERLGVWVSGKPYTSYLPVREELGSEGKVTCPRSLQANQGLGPRTPDSQTSSRQPAAFCRHAVSFIREGILLVIVQLLLYDY